MPAIAGVFENNGCRFSATGSHQRVSTDGITVVVLEHQSPTISPAQILDVYQRGGAEAVHERKHDCAIALFDQSANQLVLSRDAIGMHPLYYRAICSRLAFASRIDDVIRALGVVSPARMALALQLIHGRAPTPGKTYFDDVNSVPPGATLVFRNGQLRLLRGRFPAVQPFDDMSFTSAAETFADLFTHAVSRRLDVHARTAVLVSGGLDSSAIISCTDPHQTFGITYSAADGSAADERRYVEILQKRGYHIECVNFHPIVDVASIERAVRASENPFADDVPATLERAAQTARKHGASVLLLGTWGDQVLAPFPPPHIQTIAPWRLRALWREATAFQRYMTDVSRREVFQSFVRNSLRARTPEGWMRRMRARRRHQSVFDLLMKDCAELDPEPVPPHFGDAVHDAVSNAEHVSALETTIKWGLVNHLEVRLPFLDPGLVHWLRSVPDAIAYHNSELKPLLRTGLGDLLPREIADRRDKGDYTQAIADGMFAPADVLDALDGLRRLVDFGLMSSESAHLTLAKLSASPNIASETRSLASKLLAVDVWLREFFEAR